jgi:hypothetical protein
LRVEGGHAVACHFWEVITPPKALPAISDAVNARLARLQSAFRTDAGTGGGAPAHSEAETI